MNSFSAEIEVVDGLLGQARIMSTSRSADIDVRASALQFERLFQGWQQKLRAGRRPKYAFAFEAHAEVVSQFRLHLKFCKRMGGELRECALMIDQLFEEAYQF